MPDEVVEIPVTGKVSITASAAVKLLIADKADKKTVADIEAKIKGWTQPPNTGSGAWGGIVGNLKDQLDLVNYIGALKGGSEWLGYESVMNHGANGNGTTDDHKAIQDTINYCMTNNIRTVFFPNGKYRCIGGLVVQAPGNAWVTISFMGVSTNLNAGASRSMILFEDEPFGVGLQCVKGVRVQGLEMYGSFQHPPINANDPYTTYNYTEEQWKGTSVSSARTAPHGCFVIDPFTKTGTAPVMYKGFEANYNQGANGDPTAGSTSVIIDDSFLDGWLVPIITSPNGQTLNAEAIIINNVWFGSCYTCVSGTQAQEKMNRMTNCICWGAAYRIFSLSEFGSQEGGGNWIIDGINIAGYVIEPFKVDSGNYFPVWISNVYGESVKRVGIVKSPSGGMTDCMIDFIYPEYIGLPVDLLESSSTTSFYRCTFRYYGQTRVMPFTNLRGNFYECNFSGAPHFQAQAGFKPQFYTCYINGGKIFGEAREVSVAKNLPNSPYVKVGISTFRNDFDVNNYLEKVSFSSQDATQFYTLVEGSKDTSLNGRKFQWEVKNPNQFYVGGIVQLTDANSIIVGYAYVTSISGTTVSFDGASAGIKSGQTYYPQTIYPNEFRGTFFGDINADGTITNLKLDWGASLESFVGMVAEEPSFNAVGYKMKILSYDAIQNKFTCATNDFVTATAQKNVYFSFGIRKNVFVNRNETPDKWSNYILLQKNSTIKIFPDYENEQVFKVDRSGWNKNEDGKHLPQAVYHEIISIT